LFCDLWLREVVSKNPRSFGFFVQRKHLSHPFMDLKKKT
jgi:hypothetical protein